MKSIYRLSLLTVLVSAGYAQTTEPAPLTDPAAQRDQRRKALRTELKSQSTRPVQGDQRKQLSVQERQALRQQLLQHQQAAKAKP
jgi:hypothetical protein